VRQRLWLVLRNARGEILLERRPPSGVWGGLWCFPETSLATDESAAIETVCAALGCRVLAVRRGPAGRHVFTHFKLDYQVLEIAVAASDAVADRDARRWVDPAAPGTLGLPTPVRDLLSALPPERHPQSSTTEYTAAALPNRRF